MRDCWLFAQIKPYATPCPTDGARQGPPPDTAATAATGRLGGKDALQWFRQQGSTTHFDVIDRHGNALGCTHSLGSGFGSGMTVPGLGVTLNNFMRWNDMDPRTFLRITVD